MVDFHKGAKTQCVSIRDWSFGCYALLQHDLGISNCRWRSGLILRISVSWVVLIPLESWRAHSQCIRVRRVAMFSKSNGSGAKDGDQGGGLLRLFRRQGGRGSAECAQRSVRVFSGGGAIAFRLQAVESAKVRSRRGMDGSEVIR